MGINLIQWMTFITQMKGSYNLKVNIIHSLEDS